jgi:uncharacterized membrane protein
MEYLVVKWLHVVSSTLLFGTGIGSAWMLFTTVFTRDAHAVAVVARRVVWADWLFTATTVVLQPATGFWMLSRLQLNWADAAWTRWSVVLYALAVACWLPVVVLQFRLRDLAAGAARAGTPLPQAFWRLFTAWVALGVPAFLALLSVFWLMVARPA